MDFLDWEDRGPSSSSYKSRERPIVTGMDAVRELTHVTNMVSENKPIVNIMVMGQK